MTTDELQRLLQRLPEARIGVIGDYCLDVYWFVDMSRSDVSLETGLNTHPVAGQSYSLGGAGNVISNLAALGCGHLKSYGVVGPDPWGKELVRLLRSNGADTSGVLVQADRWATLAYAKPHIQDVEQPRLDFGNFNLLSDDTANRLIDTLEAGLPDLDVVVINQQVLEGIHTGCLRKRLIDLMEAHSGTVFIADSRHHSESYPGAYLKLNDHEAARLCGVSRGREEMVLRDEAVNSAEVLFQRYGKPIFITRGSRGCLVRDASGLHEIPGIQVLGRIDPVGAGDSVLAGIAAGLSLRQSPFDAAELGGFVAAVTIQKLRQTGTATPAEVIEVGSRPDYVYRPELADDPRRAHYLDGCEIEVITAVPPGFRPSHAIFDHDGTISTLRQGWEEIMEPMMVRAILGARFDSADESLYHRVADRVRGYIDKSTGVQTLVQMQALAALVREFECVPESDILDEHGYKLLYNGALMRMVRGRAEKLSRGELSVEDFTVKGSVPFLERLHSAGVKLILASGTDQDDVVSEAEALGYASLFEGRIYGSAGDPGRDAKRMVLERILNDAGPGAAAGLVTFGDGPVEMRETKRAGGLAVGVASDEVRRYGLNPAKRARLIRAGADLIVPDFSQTEALLRLINVA